MSKNGSFALVRLALVQSAFAIFTLTPSLTFGQQDGYIGAGNTEATIEYDFSVEGNHLKEPSYWTSKAWIDQQIQLSTGPLRQGYPQSGGWYGTPEITILRATAKPGVPGSWIVDYRFKGKAAVTNANTGNTLGLYLIHNPSTAEKIGKATCSSNDTFWYYWTPRAGCALLNSAYSTFIRARMTRIPNTVRTYPEYNRLAFKNVIRIDSLNGFSEYGETNWSETGATYPAYFYRDAAAKLRTRGFSYRKWTPDEVKTIYTKVTGRLPTVGTWEKQTPKGLAQIRMVIANSGLNYDSGGFHYFYKDALEKASMIFYHGHAGMGINIDLSKIEAKRGFKIALPTERYQFLSLRSCLPYVYYTGKYLQAKKSATDPVGSKNLDVAGFALESFFESDSQSLIRYVDAVLAWTSGVPNVPSFQDLVRPEGFLYGISGDEDNPTVIP